MPTSMTISERPRVVTVGAGFGGLFAAKAPAEGFTAPKGAPEKYLDLSYLQRARARR